MNYQIRKEWCQFTYWDQCPELPVYGRNGYHSYPLTVYNYFVAAINGLQMEGACTLMELGCGNGLLLKHLQETVEAKITPYGIDFLASSINCAKQQILPAYKDNFTISNIADFDFEGKVYDVVLLDPYLISEMDFARVLALLAQHTRVAIILYLHIDVLSALSLQSIGKFYAYSQFDTSVFDYPEISLAVLRLLKVEKHV